MSDKNMKYIIYNSLKCLDEIIDEVFNEFDSFSEEEKNDGLMYLLSDQGLQNCLSAKEFKNAADQVAFIENFIVYDLDGEALDDAAIANSLLSFWHEIEQEVKELL